MDRSAPELTTSMSSAPSAPARDNRRYGQPLALILGPRQEQVGRIEDIEPVYWRCSKAECNPDGMQGWLTKIESVIGAGLRSVDKIRYPGWNIAQISHHYRTRLSFTTLGQETSRRWHEIHVPHGGDADHALPSAGRYLISPLAPYSKGPCNCSQDHTSILYNSKKIPLGLLGGLCFNPERLRPFGWSCCMHRWTSPPMPLS